MIVPSLAPGKGCSPVIAWVVSLVVVGGETGVTHLVCDHPKCVDVALLRWIAVLQIEAGGVQQFWRHVSDGGGAGAGRWDYTVEIHNAWIRHDGKVSVICEARMEIAVDEDVYLYGNVSDSERKQVVAHTGMRLLCTISTECRYCNPLTTSASFRIIRDLSIEERGRSGVRDEGD